MNSDFCVALHALVYLDHKRCYLSSSVLAENICTNPARVRKVMAQLKKAGFIDTKEGIDGGYKTIDSISNISLDKVIDAIETDIIELNWMSGNSEMECLVASGIKDQVTLLLDSLNMDCKKRLSTITVGNIEQNLLSKK